ncbi:hypothetical protein PPERSA_09715 [Pseudocohnilembus persalinus]|uniref:Uncharacterized protein n=1 Tax=Pseudocohnilembus persalinus TaxID=266149 RepID=A0A0V0QV27_PSEPJ|nr:hypothetical protein PPERSA_09715 [Pseudocohnilembus persalinus]|eukprot:KRX06103.1 hypothetical protein PPERSA_09715 [Pseudocohnilembus persalinus]
MNDAALALFISVYCLSFTLIVCQLINKLIKKKYRKEIQNYETLKENLKMINYEDFEKNSFLNNKTIRETVQKREQEFKNKKYHPFKISFHLNRIIYLLKLSIIFCAYASIYKANALDINEVKYIDQDCYDGESFENCPDLIDLCIKLNETPEYQTVSCQLPCSFSLKDGNNQFDANLNPNPVKEMAYFVEYELYGYGATGCNGA